MTPTTELANVITAIARTAPLDTYWTDAAERASEQDPGSVPPGVYERLVSLAARYGYRVRIAPMPTGSTLGYTHGPKIMRGDDEPENTITLRPGMSPAATVRVLCHELGHVILGHPGRSHAEAAAAAQARLRRAVQTGSPEDTAGEVAVELGSAAVCALAGIGNGAFPYAYLSSRPASARTIGALRDALTCATTIWQAIEPSRTRELVAA